MITKKEKEKKKKEKLDDRSGWKMMHFSTRTRTRFDSPRYKVI